MPIQDKPILIVHSFRTTYEMLPVKGDPLNDNVDSLGNKIDAKGAVVKTLQEEDWVSYSPAHSAINTATSERIRHLRPDPLRVGNDPEGIKIGFMEARWAQIDPAYQAWKQGRALPLNGTPLENWPNVTPEMVEVLRAYQIRTVEQVRDLVPAQIERIKLPNTRDLVRQAIIFLDNADAAKAAAREAEKDQRIEALEEQIKALALAAQPAAAPIEDDEVASLRAELDAKGVAYDKRWAAPKLRALLTETAVAA